jgi:hypothetical protein
MSIKLSDEFKFVPLPPIENAVTAKFLEQPDPLGPLAQLPGKWVGTGFNQIWRPFFSKPNPTNQDHFLELNVTDETIEFSTIPGKIPNRGLLQEDIFMFGVAYLQQVFDALAPDKPGLHFEPGMWLTIPPTTNPKEPRTVARLASIPHGTSMLAQGVADTVPGGPRFDRVDITPFVIGDPGKRIPFPESNLSQASQFRIPTEANPPHITQVMVDNPNSVLEAAIAGQTITEMVVLTVSSDPNGSVVGGGTANTAFLQGTPPVPTNANAQASLVTATFWIEAVQGQGEPDFLQLQYTQTVLLDFNGLSWPHVSVGTLRQTVSDPPSRDEVDPPTSDAIYEATKSAAR